MTKYESTVVKCRQKKSLSMCFVTNGFRLRRTCRWLIQDIT